VNEDAESKHNPSSEAIHKGILVFQLSILLLDP